MTEENQAPQDDEAPALEAPKSPGPRIYQLRISGHEQPLEITADRCDMKGAGRVELFYGLGDDEQSVAQLEKVNNVSSRGMPLGAWQEVQEQRAKARLDRIAKTASLAMEVGEANAQAIDALRDQLENLYPRDESAPTPDPVAVAIAVAKEEAAQAILARIKGQNPAGLMPTSAEVLQLTQALRALGRSH